MSRCDMRAPFLLLGRDDRQRGSISQLFVGRREPDRDMPRRTQQARCKLCANPGNLEIPRCKRP